MKRIFFDALVFLVSNHLKVKTALLSLGFRTYYLLPHSLKDLKDYLGSLKVLEEATKNGTIVVWPSSQATLRQFVASLLHNL